MRLRPRDLLFRTILAVPILGLAVSSCDFVEDNHAAANATMAALATDLRLTQEAGQAQTETALPTSIIRPIGTATLVFCRSEELATQEAVAYHGLKPEDRVLVDKYRKEHPAPPVCPPGTPPPATPTPPGQ